MKTTLFIKFTSTLAFIAFVVVAFSSCQQAGRNYQKRSYETYENSNTIKTAYQKPSGPACKT